MAQSATVANAVSVENRVIFSITWTRFSTLTAFASGFAAALTRANRRNFAKSAFRPFLRNQRNLRWLLWQSKRADRAALDAMRRGNGRQRASDVIARRGAESHPARAADRIGDMRYRDVLRGEELRRR